jgi:hypothetical protein
MQAEKAHYAAECGHAELKAYPHVLFKPGFLVGENSNDVKLHTTERTEISYSPEHQRTLESTTVSEIKDPEGPKEQALKQHEQPVGPNEPAEQVVGSTNNHDSATNSPSVPHANNTSRSNQNNITPMAGRIYINSNQSVIMSSTVFGNSLREPLKSSSAEIEGSENIKEESCSLM